MRLWSPRELADVLGVSESSLKRWVDSGKIVAARTEGGHRKIAVVGGHAGATIATAQPDVRLIVTMAELAAVAAGIVGHRAA